MRALMAISIAALALLAAAPGCLETADATHCGAYQECELCAAEPACGYCYESGLCLPDAVACEGERAQLPDPCEEPK